MADLIDKNLLMEELHSIFEGDADLRKDYEYMGIDDYIRSMPTTTEAEIRSKAIEEFSEQIKAEIANCSWQFSRLEAETIDNMARELKGE